MDFHVNSARLNRDLSSIDGRQFEAYCKNRNHHLIEKDIFTQNKTVYLEIGAGTGWLFLELATRHPEIFFVAVERDRMRGNQLVTRTQKRKLTNIAAYRGNAIPALIHGVPSESVDRIYMLYPCPWPKTAHRKNRWYLHPIMPHLVRALKPGGLIIWASDQKFYIDEAHYVSEKKYRLQTVSWGVLAANSYNNLEEFPTGRTKFEHAFLKSGHDCHELISRKHLS